MKIVSVQLHPLSVDRRHKTVVALAGEVIPPADAPPSRSYFILLELRTDTGVPGFGEISDIGADEFVLPALSATLTELLVGADPFDLERLLSVADVDASVRCAVDNALYDLQGRILGVPVHDLIGGRFRDEVLVSWVVYIRQHELIEREVAELSARGFTAYKLKVGLDIDHDARCVEIIRDIAGRDAQIKIDASAAWSVDEAITNIRRLNKDRLAGVETPTNARDVDGIARIRRAVGVPIIEHIRDDLSYAIELARKDAVDVFNVSACLSGGILRAKKALAVAEAAGIECLLGSTVELGVGTAAQLHLAASSPIVTLASDLIGPGMYARDYLSVSLRYEHGHLPVPKGAGLGVDVDPVALDAMRWRGASDTPVAQIAAPTGANDGNVP